MANKIREVFRREGGKFVQGSLVGGKKVAEVRIAAAGCILQFVVHPLTGQDPYSLRPTREECEQLCPEGYEVHELASGFYAWRKGDTNFFGMEPHPSDQFVHWSSRHHNPQFEEQVAELRAAWDLLYRDPKIGKAADVVAQWKLDLLESERGELAAGEDF
jgi:hypothetical protein